MLAVFVLTGCGAGEGMGIGPELEDAGSPQGVPFMPPPGPADEVTIEAPSTPPSCPSGRFFVGRAQGQVLDLQDRPIAGGNVSICGSVCISARTGADGRFDARIESCFAPNEEYPHGATFQFDGIQQRTDVFFDFNSASVTQMGTVRFRRPFYAGSFAEGGTARAPMSSATPVRLVDGLGFALRIVPNTIEYPINATEEVVRALRVPVSRLPAFGVRAPAVAYAIAPSDAVLRAPAAVEFPNVSGLAPGTAVEIVAVGNHASNARPPIGVLDRVDTGRVSSDGRRVVADTGLRFFGLVGYRPIAR